MFRFLLLISLLGCAVTAIIGQNKPNPCVQASSFRIVILGSSTAAGTGPSQPDSAWVNRYRNYLQSINPANEVINLAVGGYSTWRLMPDNFVPPASRPDPDTNHNITEAFTYMPDAIIINLPSNDRQWPVSDQLGNFDSLYSMSLNNGIPMWITTTQPIQSAGAYQAEVKDSIFAKFGSFAIDFWTPIVGQNNEVDTIYAADPVHLNDWGHRLLVQQVIDKDILTQLYDTLASPDVALVEWEALNPSVCGDSLMDVRGVFTNLGVSILSSVSYDVELRMDNGIDSLVQTVIQPSNLNACETDTLNFKINTKAGGTLSMQINARLTADTIPLNDTAYRTLFFSGHPQMNLADDTVCLGNAASLSAISADTVFWYAAPTGGNPVEFGPALNLGNPTTDTVMYAESVRGDLFYRDELFTQLNSNVEWNGMIITVAAKTALVIDSLGINVRDSGTQAITIYRRNGGHTGFEGSIAGWDTLFNGNVQVNDIEALTSVPMPQINLPAGDSISFYMQLAAANRRLGYLSNGSANSYSSAEMDFVGSTGISHNFSGTFNPRNWSGKVYYHHGYRPEGDCKTDRQLANLRVIDVPGLAWTDSSVCDTLALSLDPAYDYIWSDGFNGSDRIFKTDSSLGVSISDASGNCSTNDSLQIMVTPLAEAAFGYTIVNDVLIWTDTSRNADFTQLFLNGAAVNDIYTVLDSSGFYELEFIASNSCNADTVKLNFNHQITTSIAPTDVSGIRIFPNPNTGSFLIDAPIEIKGIRLFDLQGRSVNIDYVQKQGKMMAETSAAAGTYLLLLETGSGVIRKRIERR